MLCPMPDVQQSVAQLVRNTVELNKERKWKVELQCIKIICRWETHALHEGRGADDVCMMLFELEQTQLA
jgi:hypothetical protein